MVRIVVLWAEPLLCHPVIADGSEVDTLVASNPGSCERGNRDGDADTQRDPDCSHERPVTAIAIAVAPLELPSLESPAWVHPRRFTLVGSRSESVSDCLDHSRITTRNSWACSCN